MFAVRKAMSKGYSISPGNTARKQLPDIDWPSQQISLEKVAPARHQHVLLSDRLNGGLMKPLDAQ
jgi:hypothetical protein